MCARVFSKQTNAIMPAQIGTIYGYIGMAVWKSQIAAKYNGLELGFKQTQPRIDSSKPEFLAKFPLGKVPTFEDSEGFYLNESDAIAYYGMLKFFIACANFTSC